MDHAPLLPLLPVDRVGTVERVEPIALGLSGAGVYAVTASRGAFVLRVQGETIHSVSFEEQLRILRRAADAGVAPAVVHVDEAARAVVSARVAGVPLAQALGDPAVRPRVIGSIVEKLRVLHAIDASGISERTPVAYVRTLSETMRERRGFPPWARALGPAVDSIADVLARDPRRVVSHNDTNPLNVLWDGERAWLVDWEVGGLAHPYYDLATLALFLRLPDDAAFALAARHDGAPLGESAREVFRALRQLIALLCGLTFLSTVDDLGVRTANERADAPSLGDCYAAMHTGELDLQSPYGRASFGLALLAEGVFPPAA